MTDADAGRPDLILPPQEAEAVQRAYQDATCILEYGSGGSTAIAADLAGKVVFSVESDREWALRMASWLSSTARASVVNMHHADIGPTLPWGYPADETTKDLWGSYAMSVWDRTDFRHPDVVLIDGRFRVSCFLAVLQNIARPVDVLFDDYTDRPPYHVVEDLVKPVEHFGRMARFRLTPGLRSPRVASLQRRAVTTPL